MALELLDTSALLLYAHVYCSYHCNITSDTESCKNKLMCFIISNKMLQIDYKNKQCVENLQLI